MTAPHDLPTFDDHCEDCATWIIAYRSATFPGPLYLVWLTDTDEDSTDKLLTFKNGDIFAVQSLSDIQATILASVDALHVVGHLRRWLDNLDGLEVTASPAYDRIAIQTALASAQLDVPTVEGIASFINLFGDFVRQDERNAHLQVYEDQELVQDTWDYYYQYIFWPRFNDKEKFEAWDRPPLVIDVQALVVQLEAVFGAFEKYIKVAD